MKKVAFVGLLLLLLSGCASKEVFESLADGPCTAKQKREITAVTPKRAASKTLETLEMSKSLKIHYGVDIALTQIGHMFNAFDSDAKILSERIGLKSFEKYGFLTVGFPVNSRETYFGKIKEAQLSFITIVETGKDSRGSIREFGEVFPKENAEHPVKDSQLLSLHCLQE